jgi:hypothetical protein
LVVKEVVFDCWFCKGFVWIFSLKKKIQRVLWLSTTWLFILKFLLSATPIFVLYFILMQHRESAVLVLVLNFFWGGFHSITRTLSDDDDGRIIKSSWVFSFYPPFAVFINVFVLLMLSSSFCHKHSIPIKPKDSERLHFNFYIFLFV